MTTAPNVFEDRARLAKTLALVAAIGGFATKYGLDPVEVVSRAGYREWHLFSVLAHTTDPSDTTKGLVLDAFTEAARIAGEVAP
jgi:hypothetical protein